MKKISNLKLKAKALMLASVSLVSLSACDDSEFDDVAFVDSTVAVENDSTSKEVSETATGKTGTDATEGYTEEFVEDDEVYYTDVVVDTDGTYTYDTTVKDETNTSKSSTADSTEKTTKSTTKGTEKNSSSTPNRPSDGRVVGADVTTASTKKNSTTTTTVTTKKTTEKTTKTTEKTTKTTTKPTTTKTEPTTEPVTEPPVVSYNINDICYSADAFNYFADILAEDLRTAPDGGKYLSVNTGYGPSSGVNEAKYILALLNNGSINADVLATSLAGLTNNFYNYSSFVYELPQYETLIGRAINLSSYTCDNRKYFSDYAINIQNSYFNGTFSDFVTDQIINNHIDSTLYNDVSIKSFFVGCNNDYGVFDPTDFDFDVLMYINNLQSIVNGRSYTY